MIIFTKTKYETASFDFRKITKWLQLEVQLFFVNEMAVLINLAKVIKATFIWSSKHRNLKHSVDCLCLKYKVGFVLQKNESEGLFDFCLINRTTRET